MKHCDCLQSPVSLVVSLPVEGDAFYVNVGIEEKRKAIQSVTMAG